MRARRILVTAEAMSDRLAYAAMGITPGTLRISIGDGDWRVVPPIDDFWEDAWQLWLAQGAEFWDGGAWRPISGLREWRFGAAA
jgi:hypothetical protein